MTRQRQSSPGQLRHATLGAALALTLCACGGTGGSGTATTDATGPGSEQTFVLIGDMQAVQSGAQAAPQFHAAPLVLEAPRDTDRVEASASAHSPPHLQVVSPELAQLSTRRLTQALMRSVLVDGVVPEQASADQPGATPLASGTVVATYTPAQIRAAYALAPLPASGALTGAQSAALGAGQTIYLIDAHDDPNVAAELAAFNASFGLPACTAVSVRTTATLPLAPASAGGCTLSVVHATASGRMTSSAPTYDSGWATEIAVDVEWSHATAPLARIIVIEAPDSSSKSLLAAIQLADAMGPGVVSMSFGAPEGSWTASVDSAFTLGNMSYVASAGDTGAEVQWPAVSPHVIAVGGSKLTYTGEGPRSEVVWSGTGGGVSSYTPTPSYQTGAVPGMGTPAHRAVSDVTFNADPKTGQYLATMARGATSVSWLSAGGTSLATAQWAGILAIANAQRARASQQPLGAPHALLYAIAAQPALYAQDFSDITHGSDGTCDSCFAEIGYDLPTGIGSPNVSSLLSSLAGAPGAGVAVALTAPVVTVPSVNGIAGTPLSFAVAVTSAGPVSYSLSTAPAGMTISSTGTVSWAAPVAGMYSVTVTATDARTALSGAAVCGVRIVVPGPLITATPLGGAAGTPLSGTIAVADGTSNTVAVTLSGIPRGMTFTVNGMSLLANWSAPSAGSYKLTVNAKDGNGLTAAAVVPVTVTAR
jgi:hypothetical protein